MAKSGHFRASLQGLKTKGELQQENLALRLAINPTAHTDTARVYKHGCAGVSKRGTGNHGITTCRGLTLAVEAKEFNSDRGLVKFYLIDSKAEMPTRQNSFLPIGVKFLDSLKTRFPYSDHVIAQFEQAPIFSLCTNSGLVLKENFSVSLFDDEIRHDILGNVNATSGVTLPRILCFPMRLWTLGPHVCSTRKSLCNPIYEALVGNSHIHLWLIVTGFCRWSWMLLSAYVKAAFSIHDSSQICQFFTCGHKSPFQTKRKDIRFMDVGQSETDCERLNGGTPNGDAIVRAYGNKNRKSEAEMTSPALAS